VDGLCSAEYSAVRHPPASHVGNLPPSQDNSSVYGLNAAMLAEAASQITLSNATNSTIGTGANGAFATGSGSSVTLARVAIPATSHLTTLTDGAGISGSTLANTLGNGVAADYDADTSATSWLNGRTYASSGSGALAPRQARASADVPRAVTADRGR
jgi:hypothetical protein